MSYTTIKAVWPGEKHEDIEGLRNSHGSAPVIWNAMCVKHLVAEEYTYMLHGNIDKLWPLWEDLSIPEHQRAVLMMTYDRAYVTKKDYHRAASDIEKFLADFPPKLGYANHWPRIKDVFSGDPDFPAIGFHVTSVSEDLFDGEWDEDLEEYGQPDWDMFYDLYSEIDGLKQ